MNALIRDRDKVLGTHSGVGVAIAGLRTVQVMAEVGGDNGYRAGRAEKGGQESGDRPRRRVPHDNGKNRYPWTQGADQER
jgi:hypothetical protein